MSSDPYAGDPTHLRWIVPVLTITNSDGSEDAGHPQVGVPIVDKFGARRTYEEANEKTEKLWLRKTANYLVYESRMSLSKKGNTLFILSDFPSGYRLYTQFTRQKGSKEVRTDTYLIGSTTEKCARFRSPEEFAPHAKWLAYGSPKDQCQCRWCSDTKQGGISKRLREATSFIRNWDDTRPTSTSHARDHSIRTSTRIVPQKIMAKDYTRVNEGRISTWEES